MNENGLVLAAGDIEVGHHRQADDPGSDRQRRHRVVERARRPDRLRRSGSTWPGGPPAGGRASCSWRSRPSSAPSQKQVESTMGNVAPFVVPLAVTLFFFILIANWLELIPSRALSRVAVGRHQHDVGAGAVVVDLGARRAHQATRAAAPTSSTTRSAYPALLPLNGARGDRQAVHAGPATVRQHLRRRDHDRHHRR